VASFGPLNYGKKNCQNLRTGTNIDGYCQDRTPALNFLVCKLARSNKLTSTVEHNYHL